MADLAQFWPLAGVVLSSPEVNSSATLVNSLQMADLAQFWPLAGVVLSSPEFNSSATLVNSLQQQEEYLTGLPPASLVY